MRALSTLALGLALASVLAACGGKTDDTVTPPSACSGFSAGTLPALAANQVVFDSNREGNHEIYVMGSDGSSPTRLTHDAAYENWWPRISPDRKKVLFYRAPPGSSENYGAASLWVMNADGSGLTRLRAQGADGWTLQGHAEWSPDGSRIAMFGTTATSAEIFVTDACGQNPVQYTNRGGVNTDVSWSPDGQQLVFNGCPSAAGCAPAHYEIYAMNATPLAPATRLTNNTVADYDPYFSPDGSRLAWLVNVDPTANVVPNTTLAIGRWAIAMVDVDAGGALSNAHYLIDDGNINSKPAWSLDGQTVFFHRMVLSEGLRFRVFSIGADGSGLTELTPGATGTSEYPSN
ncbi:MAG: PD40 domain-containing protein [Rhizobacter sp.]|nr:PD40 domain-containing protein [Rhizobacter sp.]